MFSLIIKFIADHRDNTIKCYRWQRSGEQLDTITYNKGQHPVLDVLSDHEQVEWHAACKALGWEN